MTANINGCEITLLFNEPQNSGQFGYVNRIVERARTLFTEAGYKLQNGQELLGLDTFAQKWAVVKPDNREEGDFDTEPTIYIVDMEQASCNCDGFLRDNDCKHRIAVAYHLAREAGFEANQLAQYDPNEVAGRDEYPL